MFAEDGVGSCRRVTWWGALCPRLPRSGSPLASARVDIRLAAAGDWPFDWGGAFEGRGDVRQHFPSGARAYLRDPLPRTLCDAARFLYDLPRPRGAAGLRHIQVRARSHTHKHTHVKAGYPRALGGHTGLLPRPQGSTTLPGILPLAWIYFSFYTPGWPVRTPSVKTRPPGIYNQRVINHTTRSRSLPTRGYVERWHAHIATTGGPHRCSLYLREYT